jgi:hypothetical protein
VLALLGAAGSDDERMGVLLLLALVLALNFARKAVLTALAVGGIAYCTVFGGVILFSIAALVCTLLVAFPPLALLVVPLAVSFMFWASIIAWFFACAAIVWCCCCRDSAAAAPAVQPVARGRRA